MPVVRVSAGSDMSSAAAPTRLFGPMAMVTEETGLQCVVATREFVSPGHPGLGLTEFPAATRPLGFISNVCFTTDVGTAVISAFKDRTHCLLASATDRPEFHHTAFQDLLLAQGPPLNSWTVQSWILVGATTSGFERELRDLRSMVSSFQRLIPLSRSPQLLQLSREAAVRREQRQFEDVESWAQRLARDVLNADD
jgi:hypothetical protein